MESHGDRGETDKKLYVRWMPRDREKAPLPWRDEISFGPLLLQGSAVGLSPATSEHRVPGPGRGKPKGDLAQPGLPGQCFWDEGEALEQPGVPGTLKWSQSGGGGG